MRSEPLPLQKPLPSEEKGGWNRIEETYGNKDAPLRDYAGVIVLFAVVAGGLVFARKRSLLEKVELNDLLLLGLATQKVSRVLTKSRVASVVRAPFTRYEGSAGAGEVEERPRGRGLRRAIGELVSCPFCMGTWIACASVAGFVAHPRLARTLASIFAVGSIADFIQQAYCRMKEASDQGDRV